MKTGRSNRQAGRSFRHQAASGIGSALVLFLPKCPLCWVALFGSAAIGAAPWKIEAGGLALFALGAWVLLRRSMSSALAAVLSIAIAALILLGARNISAWPLRVAVWGAVAAAFYLLGMRKGFACEAVHCGGSSAEPKTTPSPLRRGAFSLFLPAVLLLVSSSAAQAQKPVRIQIDAHAQATPFPHIWEEMFGSGRAALSLRESYRNDLRAVHEITGFRYVRFHAILHDELGVYNEDEHGNPVYNFSYVDQIYDGLLRNGVRPVVEISFMPKKLAFNPDALHPFWYKQNVSPPKSMERWDDLMLAFATHLVQRYGRAEVATWYFEVWNEPNIDFWGGIPRQESYFDLYAHTARALKSVDPNLRVGGPATAAAAWIPEFLRYAADNKVPVDFVSTHGYADEPASRLLGTNANISPEDMMGAVVAKVRKQIDSSPLPHLPLLWTEWNVDSENDARETPYVGPAVANVVRECDGLAQALSFWTFSEVFEEDGPPAAPFEHFGLRAVGGINKAAFYDFALLHQLGYQRLANPSRNAIVTRLDDGSLSMAVWNLVPRKEAPHSLSVDLDITGVAPDAAVTVVRVDETHSNAFPLWKKMGRPSSPTEAQVQELNHATALEAPEKMRLRNGSLSLDLGSDALLLVHVNTR